MSTEASNGAVLFTIIGTLVVLLSPVITFFAGIFVGGITLLAGISVAVLWRE